MQDNASGRPQYSVSSSYISAHCALFWALCIQFVVIFFHRVGDFSLFLLSAFGLYSSSLFVHRSSAIRFVLSRFEHILVHPKDIPVFSWYHVGFQTTKLCHPQIADLLGFSHSYLNPFRSIQASRSITLSYTDRTDSYGVGVLV